MGFVAVEKGTANVYDCIIVGAGVSGVNSAYRVQEQLPDWSYTIIEGRGAIGGTWDLFRYPGIRSDSDLHTFGFPWHPWVDKRAIADGPAIKSYMQETASKFGIDKNIQFHHMMQSANWSSEQQMWTLEVETPEGKKNMHTRFLFLSTGYYDYKEVLPTLIPGLENFKGTVIHPQFWPEDLDYTGKRMAIIGSGATAVTLLPVLGEKAAQVTMIQRSPTYVMTLPRTSPLNALIARIFPQWLAYKLIRFNFLTVGYLFNKFCAAYPKAARGLLTKGALRQLPTRIPVDPHFTPAYSPWEQRLCVCPDGDFYKALRGGKTDIATGKIKTVTEHSIQLESGQTIDADILITATGLKIQMAGGARISVDNDPVIIGTKYLWNGCMIEDLPNCAMNIGYVDASWTLGADATAQLICRLAKYMKQKGYTCATPRAEKTLQPQAAFGLSSTYVKKASDEMPNVGDKKPWLRRSNYFTDYWTAKRGDLTAGIEYERVSS